ncbi:hypothetical protein P4S73_11245 [Paraglaciecola sp. Hal342]
MLWRSHQLNSVHGKYSWSLRQTALKWIEEGKGWSKRTTFARLEERSSTASVYANFVPEYDEERSIGP